MLRTCKFSVAHDGLRNITSLDGLYTEAIFKETLLQYKLKIIINDTTVNNIRYDNDSLILVNSQAELQKDDGKNY